MFAKRKLQKKVPPQKTLSKPTKDPPPGSNVVRLYL